MRKPSQRVEVLRNLEKQVGDLIVSTTLCHTPQAHIC
jgi:hypothetical protein